MNIEGFTIIHQREIFDRDYLVRFAQDKDGKWSIHPLTDTTRRRLTDARIRGIPLDLGFRAVVQTAHEIAGSNIHVTYSNEVNSLYSIKDTELLIAKTDEGWMVTCEGGQSFLDQSGVEPVYRAYARELVGKVFKTRKALLQLLRQITDEEIARGVDNTITIDQWQLQLMSAVELLNVHGVRLWGVNDRWRVEGITPNARGNLNRYGLLYQDLHYSGDHPGQQLVRLANKACQFGGDVGEQYLLNRHIRYGVIGTGLSLAHGFHNSLDTDSWEFIPHGVEWLHEMPHYCQTAYTHLDRQIFRSKEAALHQLSITMRQEALSQLTQILSMVKLS